MSGYIITCFDNDLKKGIDIFTPSLKGFKGCTTTTHLFLGLKDNRLYVSTEFKDLQKEETIGIIEFNHWRLYMPNLFDFNSDDKRLEVKDKQDNIVFSIEYVSNFGVKIGGYFIDSKSIIILHNNIKDSLDTFPTCISRRDSLWKEKAIVEIKKIQPIFK